MLKYKIALINVWWDENSEDTRFFDSISTQKLYFDGLTSGLFSPLVNFNMGDNITTSCYVKDVTGRTPEDLCKCNYAVIIKLNEEEQEIERRYFFAKCSQDSSTQMFVQLNLDDIQTNYIPNRNNLNECIIKRAHLNRWIENEDNTITFDNSLNSDLFINEDFTPSQLVKTREKLTFKESEDNLLNEWLNNNVLYWVYIFIDPNHNYKIFNENGAYTAQGKEFVEYYFLNDQHIETGILFYPVFKDNDSHIRVTQVVSDTRLNIEINSAGETIFRNENNNVEYFYSKKISPIFKDYFTNYTINEKILTLNSDNYINGFAIFDSHLRAFSSESFSTSAGVQFVSGLFTSGIYGKDIISCDYELSEKFTFNKNEIIEQDANIIHEPKILGSNFKKLNLCFSDGNSFEYDIQAIGDKNIELLYSELIIPEVTKYYARLKSIGIYQEPTQKNFNGLVGSVDNSLSLINDAYSNFIANNKNYWLQSTGSILSSGVNALIGGINANPLAVVGGIGGAIASGINAYTTYDNIKNQKSQKDNASGNILFNSFIMNLGLYVEIYSALESDLKTAYNYFLKYGYKYGKLGKISDFDNIRALYNYISVEFDNININISNKEKERLKNKLNSIRFWDSDLIRYNKENYERWLTNGNI